MKGDLVVRMLSLLRSKFSGTETMNVHEAWDFEAEYKQAIAIAEQEQKCVSLLRSACGFIPKQIQTLNGDLRKEIEQELAALDKLENGK